MHERQTDLFVDSVSPEDLTKLYELLDKQRQGIEVLTDILMYVCRILFTIQYYNLYLYCRKDNRDILIMKNAVIQKKTSTVY